MLVSSHIPSAYLKVTCTWFLYLPPLMGTPDSALLGLEVSGLWEAGKAKGLMPPEFQQKVWLNTPVSSPLAEGKP